MAIPGLQSIGYDLSGLVFPDVSKTWALQRQYLWNLFMPHSINGILGHLVSQYCQEIRIGQYSMRQLSIMQYGAFQRFYAGVQNIQSSRLTFLMPIDNTVIDYFQGWYDLIIDAAGYYYPKNEYKKNVYVALYDKTRVESMRFILHGAFPTTRPSVDLSYTSEDMLRINVDLQVNQVEVYSLISKVRTDVTNVVGDVARKAKESLGDMGGLSDQIRQEGIL
jgi:hypothetical protein